MILDAGFAKKNRRPLRSGGRLWIGDRGGLERVVHAERAAVAGDAVVGGDLTAVAEVEAEALG